MKEIETLYGKTGGENGGGENKVGYIRGNLTDWQGRRNIDDITAEVLKRTEHLAGIKLEVRKDGNGACIRGNRSSWRSARASLSYCSQRWRK